MNKKTFLIILLVIIILILILCLPTFIWSYKGVI